MSPSCYSLRFFFLICILPLCCSFFLFLILISMPQHTNEETCSVRLPNQATETIILYIYILLMKYLVPFALPFIQTSIFFLCMHMNRSLTFMYTNLFYFVCMPFYIIFILIMPLWIIPSCLIFLYYLVPPLCSLLILALSLFSFF